MKDHNEDTTRGVLLNIPTPDLELPEDPVDAEGFQIEEPAPLELESGEAADDPSGPAALELEESFPGDEPFQASLELEEAVPEDEPFQANLELEEAVPEDEPFQANLELEEAVPEDMPFQADPELPDEKDIEEIHPDGDHNSSSGIVLELSEEKPQGIVLELSEDSSPDGEAADSSGSEGSGPDGEDTDMSGTAADDGASEGSGPDDEAADSSTAADDGGHEGSGPDGSGSGNGPDDSGEKTSAGPGDDTETGKKPAWLKKLILPVVALAVIAAAVLAVIFYMRAKDAPKAVVTRFLNCAKKLDFDGMDDFLQSHDLSAFEGADVKNEAYKDYFKSVNKNMSFSVSNTNVDLDGETAQVTAHVKYLDNTGVYREALSDLLRMVVSSSYGDTAANAEEGTAESDAQNDDKAAEDSEAAEDDKAADDAQEPEDAKAADDAPVEELSQIDSSDLAKLSEEQIQETILSLLNEKKDASDPVYTETDIVYPMIKADGDWKIVMLDSQTVRAMSANCVSIEDEITRMAEAAQAEQVKTVDQDNLIDLDCESFSIEYNRSSLGKDFPGNPCLMLYYDYTNKSSVPSSAMVDVRITVYQHGNVCSPAIPEDNHSDTASFTREVAPGETITVCQAFSLEDTSDVTIQASEAHFGSGTIHSQILSF